MDRKGRIQCAVLILCLIMAAQACQTEKEQLVRCLISFEDYGYPVKSDDPDEDRISDISLMVFDERGDAEKCIWLPQVQEDISLELVKGKSYSFRVCANFGYQVYADHIDELEELTYHMAYPDEYREGIPMCAAADDIRVGNDGKVSLSLVRLMSRISLRIDRRKLDEDVEMYVRSVTIGNCPRSVKVFTPSSVKNPDQCFAVGFSKDDYQTSVLNTTMADGKSGEISLYMLENMQGQMKHPVSSDDMKQFEEDDPMRDICSYVEMEIDYLSSDKYSESPLVYRFYLGEDRNNLDVERNCSYSITVTPEGEGLSGHGWRIDKSGIRNDGPVYFHAYPSGYINGDIGDRIHIWCEFSPPDTQFDVGRKYMEDDRRNGIYDYVMDDDGHGATLTLTGPGTGLIYMEAGEPINDAALFIIEVNTPKD